MKNFSKTLVISAALISTSAIAQSSPSSISGPPDANQYLPFGVSTPAMTGTRPDGSTFDYRFDRKRVAHFWKTYAHRQVPGGTTFSNIPANWTGNLQNCVEGTINIGLQEAAIRQANWYRAMVGVRPVVNGSIEDRKAAQQAALVNQDAANTGLTHTPAPTSPCFSTATSDAAGRSLLGSYSTDFNQGPGSSDNWVQSYGHRRFIIDSRTYSLAYGQTLGTKLTLPSEAIPKVSAMTPRMYGSATATNSSTLLWPSEGYVPYQTYPVFTRKWSMGCDGCDFAAATVKVLLNGKATNAIFAAVSTDFGTPTFVWELPEVDYRQYEPYGSAVFRQDDVFEVTVTYRQNGQPAIKTYRTTVFNPEVDTDFVPPFDLTDMWWVPTESGWGMKLTQATDGNVFGAVYFYDDVGNPRWMTIQGAWTASGVFSGKLYTTRGPGFNANPFNPAAVTVQEAGAGTLTFSPDTQSVRFDFTMGTQSASKQMVRFANIAEGYRDGRTIEACGGTPRKVAGGSPFCIATTPCLSLGSPTTRTVRNCGQLCRGTGQTPTPLRESCTQPNKHRGTLLFSTQAQLK
jgi:hypothetical protein